MVTVSRSEFMDQMNQRLQAHKDYVEGMAFVPFPLGAPLEAATGYTWTPEGVWKPMQQIATKAQRQFNVIA